MKIQKTNNKKNAMSTQNNMSELGKMPPQAIDFEEVVLGALMLEKSAFISVSEILKPEMFYKENHQTIYYAITLLDYENEPIDILTVTEKLKKIGKLKTVGGAFYITQLTSRIASSANIEYHATILLQKYLQRELIRFSQSILKEAFDDTSDVIQLLESANTDLNQISELQFGKSNKMEFGEIIKLSLDALTKREICAKENKLCGIPTGLAQLNHLLNGWQNSDLIIIASRPGMGKTAFSLFFARVAIKHDRKVLYFSLEMDKVQLMDRILIAESKVRPERYRSGYVSKLERQKVDETAVNIYHFKLQIDDKSGIKINYIRTQAQIAKRKNDCDMIVIDYLQLIDPPTDNKTYNRESEIATISRKCKQLAKELQVPILLLCQLSRDCDKRGGTKEPVLSDLRESGAIEQDADIVIFPYRPAYYEIKKEDGSDSYGEGKLIVAKHRNGLTGIIPFRHDESITNFYDYENIQEENI